MVSVKVFVFAFILMLIAIAYPIISLKGKTTPKTGGRPSSSKKGDDNYFNTINPWEEPSKTSYKYKGISVNGTETCNIYTYENLLSGKEYNSPLDVVSKGLKPNISTVFDDYVNGLNHVESSDYKLGCLGPDQIKANFVSQKCKSKIGTSPSNLVCYTPTGVKVDPGNIEEFS